MKQSWRALIGLARPSPLPESSTEPDLTRPLLRLSPYAEDAISIRDSFCGMLAIGETGAGKSTASGAALARAFLRHGYGGLVLTCKPDETATWRKYCAETGRLDSLRVFGPEESWRFNFLSFERSRSGRGSGQTENVVNLLVEVIELLERRDGQTRSDPYWDRSLRQLLRNGIELLSVARGELRLSELADLVTSAPRDPAELQSESWQERSFFMRCLRDAEQKEKTERQHHDFEMTARFWLREFPTLSDRTRSIIAQSFTSLADALLRGLAHELFCTATNLTPEFTHAGGIIVLDLPLKQFDAVGLICQTIFKLCWQRAIERRDLAKFPAPNFLFCDEAAWFLCRSDPLFQTTARSARCASVLLTQNIGNLQHALGKAATDTLVSNLSTKFIHANSDVATNQWASDLFAKTYEYRTTAGISTREGQFGGFTTAHNASGHHALEHQILPIAFSRLRRGGPENGWAVDAFVFSGGRQWRATGKNFLRVTFHQDPYTPHSMARDVIKQSVRCGRQAFRLARCTAKLLLILMPPSLEVFLHTRFGSRYLPRLAGSLVLFLLYRQCALLTSAAAANQRERVILGLYALGFLGLGLFHLAAVCTRRLRGEGDTHSGAPGVPWPVWSRLRLSPPVVRCCLEPILCFLAGLGIGRYTPALAFWIRGASVALLVKVLLEWWRQRDRTLDALDARIEAEQLNERLEERLTPQAGTERSYVVKAAEGPGTPEG